MLLDAIRSDGSTALLSSHIVTDVEEACDRLAILGGGKVLLDCPLETARKVHRLTDSDSPPPGATAIGSFAGRGTKRLTLWRLPEGELADAGAGNQGADGGADSTEEASLEDVVLGYLAAGRGTFGLQLN